MMFSLLSQGYGTYDGTAKKDAQEIPDQKVRLTNNKQRMLWFCIGTSLFILLCKTVLFCSLLSPRNSNFACCMKREGFMTHLPHFIHKLTNPANYRRFIDLFACLLQENVKCIALRSSNAVRVRLARQFLYSAQNAGFSLVLVKPDFFRCEQGKTERS